MKPVAQKKSSSRYHRCVRAGRFGWIYSKKKRKGIIGTSVVVNEASGLMNHKRMSYIARRVYGDLMDV